LNQKKHKNEQRKHSGGKMPKKFTIETPPKESMLNITPQVKQVVEASAVLEGMCVVFIPHTTAGLTLNSIMDSATAQDIKDEIRRLVPTRVDFEHIYDTPADAAGHIKATLVGASLSLIISGGDLLLGGSQGIYFCEFDGPRTREVYVKIIGEG
jgi:secondary thiamine-phosphate synthase enzyme